MLVVCFVFVEGVVEVDFVIVEGVFGEYVDMLEDYFVVIW